MKVKLVGVRAAFLEALFEAQEFKAGDGRPRFSATFFVTKGDANHKALSEAIKQVAAEAWKGKADAILDEIKGNSNKFCLSNGDTKNYDSAAGCMVLGAHRKKSDGRPGIYNKDKSPVTESDGVIYSGCYVNATVDIWAQTKNEGAPAIRCGLIGIQFDHDGDAFSGASTPDVDDFDDLSSGSSAPSDLV
jgi:hypothetical protein